MLLLKPNCECCDKDLPPDSTEARICSFECTFCADCVEGILLNVCPNCGGGFVPRPIRPVKDHRGGNFLGAYPASTERVIRRVDAASHAGFAADIKTIPPNGRMGYTKQLAKHAGGCHCGRVRFEMMAPAEITVSQCNCSICSKSGYLGYVVRAERFTLLKGEDGLTTYTFNTGTAKHLFCSYCGIKSFYVPRSHPDGYNVNARCLDPGTVQHMTINPVDGQNWERRYPKGRAECYPDE